MTKQISKRGKSNINSGNKERCVDRYNCILIVVVLWNQTEKLSKNTATLTTQTNLIHSQKEYAMVKRVYIVVFEHDLATSE